MTGFTFPDDVPVLTDGEVTLRAHRRSDIPRIVQFATDERSRRFVSALPHPYGEPEARAFVDSRADQWQADPMHPVWAIDLDGEFAGSINLHPRARAAYEIGYGAHPDVRGRGVVTRAARLAITYAVRELGAGSLVWRCDAGNFASWRAAWANGFRFVASWPDAERGLDGEPVAVWLGHLATDGWTGGPARPWWEPAVLRGEHVVLRPWTRDDAPTEGPDELATRFVATSGLQPAPEDFEAWLLERRRRMAAGAGVCWCIADRETDRVLGHVQVDGLDVDFIAGTGQVAYWLLPDARGRGLLGEALEMVIGHAFAPRTDDAGSSGLGLHRLQAGTDEDNRGSARALRRAGFREFAHEREVLAAADGSHRGALTFELLASDDREAQRVSPLAIPTLRTERFVLREWTEADRPRPDQVTDPDARRFMAGELPTAQTHDAALRRRRRLADTGAALTWCITDRETGDVLGNIGLFSIGEGTRGNAEVGYWLWSQARGRGVIGEVLEPVIDHGFETLGLTRLHAETDLENIASQRILLRAGFRQWGTDHAAYTNADGSETDGAYFELLAAEDRGAHGSQLPPRLESEAVVLRPLETVDAQRIWETWSDPQSRVWLDLREEPTLEKARRYARAKRYVDRAAHGIWWAICEPGSIDFLGAVGLQEITDGPPRRAEVGYWVHPDARRRGLATAAVGVAAAYGLDPDGLDRERLVLNVADGNEASVRIAEATGFTQVGRDRAAEPLGDGRVVDLLRFDRLRGAHGGIPASDRS
ncbi:GNAT family N-acetyltransferase [Calidifontibacter sp. DB0510]|uniref:GNAT family N-acetyltransferase n=1 Tax=Metallococcus carri TaxID=1656884 RepID=A0A967AXI7_9MICO|nr:GNAT family N-acetyltransferase [Metallococcus carri]NHN54548.1 GNAT family N-acetyltransferase [Metallococcus carri]NOP36613.1 GNAT family N-acetyltransferase [Calidifontibacter sp. DB2511S]